MRGFTVPEQKADKRHESSEWREVASTKPRRASRDYCKSAAVRDCRVFQFLQAGSKLKVPLVKAPDVPIVLHATPGPAANRPAEHDAKAGSSSNSAADADNADVIVLVVVFSSFPFFPPSQKVRPRVIAPNNSVLKK